MLFRSLRLDVDSLSDGSLFLESLTGMTDGIVSYGEMHFSLCHHPGNRMLSEHQDKLDPTDVAVTGLEATAAPVGNVGGKLRGRNQRFELACSVVATAYRTKSTDTCWLLFPTLLQHCARRPLKERTAQ